ncbi:hypothetical protein V496_09796 [Pseudogymnoascus sp. VKM F-4515 (FW-2607)]|nr:hypothetical protein V496_09796 [Pseudogymnoascus sp. VKM F-4515 (FW-2607)]
MRQTATMIEITATLDNTAIDDGMRTPTMMGINIADAYDLKHRADASERELLIEQIRLKCEKRKNELLQSMLSKSFVGWANSLQCCLALVNSNHALWLEVQRLRSIVETSETAD